MRRSFLIALARIIGLLLLLPPLLGGCSMLRIAYNQAPEVGYWWLDRYADFDTNQSSHARDSIEAWFRWHRATQLVPYANALARARQEVLAPATPAQACAWFEVAVGFGHTAFAVGASALAEHALTMTPDQLRHLESRFQRDLDKMRDEYLQPDRSERQEENMRRAVERFETLYGNLEPAQREAVSRIIAASPFDPERWFVERLARQQDVLAVLRRALQDKPPVATLKAEFVRLAQQTEHSPRPAYRDYQRRLVDYNCAFFAQIHNQTTPAQREAAAAKLKGWEDDLRSLASGAVAPTGVP